jgi:hypothetical protein
MSCNVQTNRRLRFVEKQNSSSGIQSGSQYIGEETARQRIPIADGGYLFTDVFNKTTKELIEAKASGARVYVRAGLGQVLDYSRYIPHSRRALLLPTALTDDMLELLHTYGVGVIWESGNTFERSDAPL